MASTTASGPLAEPCLSAEIEEAICWMLRLSSADVGDDDRIRHNDWLMRSTAHVDAWKSLSASMAPLDVASRYSLAQRKRKHGVDRRTMLRSIMGIGVVGAAAATVAQRFVPLADIGADHLTFTGEQRTIELDDGSSLILGPRTAVDIDFKTGVRNIVLREGEFMLQGRRDDFVPILVKANELTLRSEGGGTFVARQSGARTKIVAVDSNATVMWRTQSVPLNKEQAITLDGDTISKDVAKIDTETSWVNGQLVCNNEKLIRVVDRLKPYFPGVIRVDPVVAEIPVIAVLPLKDLGWAFDLIGAFPGVAVERLTPYWVSIGPAANRSI